jgi:uncharacterized membrane-anchored protein
MKPLALIAFGILFPATSNSQGPQAPNQTAEEFEAKLGYQTGTVSIRGGLATIHLPETFRFIGPEGSRRLLTEAWNNPKGAADGVLGMLIPASLSPLSREGWGIVITYDEDGYVDDKGASTIDYDKLLKELQEGASEASKERVRQGYQPIAVVGWAEPPSYDSVAHKLYWAKELAFGDDTLHTLNYNIRILGRRGVLVLNAVASMDVLPAVRTEAQSILASVEFNEGHRYSDYLPGKDKAAKYGIIGLVAGVAAAKAGFFKLIWVAILGFKKLILVGLAAGAAALKRLAGRRKKEAPAPPVASPR